jgi:hypothetical protein
VWPAAKRRLRTHLGRWPGVRVDIGTVEEVEVCDELSKEPDNHPAAVNHREGPAVQLGRAPRRGQAGRGPDNTSRPIGCHLARSARSQTSHRSPTTTARIDDPTGSTEWRQVPGGRAGRGALWRSATAMDSRNGGGTCLVRSTAAVTPVGVAVLPDRQSVARLAAAGCRLPGRW